MKKILLWIVMLLVITSLVSLLFIGCKEEVAEEEVAEEEVAEEEVAEEEAAETTAAEGIVKVAHFAGPEADLLATQIPKFEEETGIDIQMDMLSRDETPVVFLRELIEGSGTYDVCFIGGTELVVYGYKGKILALDDYLSPEEIENLYARAKYSNPNTGKIIAMPYCTNWQMLFYRSDLLNDPDEQAAFKSEYGRELTIPQTYDELYDIVSFFNRPPDLYGYMVGGADWSVRFDFEYFLFGEGGNLGDEDGNLTINTPEAIKAMENTVRFAKLGPPGWETQTFFDADQLMLDGKLFAYTNWFYIWAQLQKDMGDKAGMSAPIQGGEFFQGTYGVIPESAPNPDAAVAFLKWMTTLDVQKEQVLTLGNLPGTTEAIEDSEVREFLQPMEEFEKGLTRCVYPLITWENEAVEGINEAFYMVLNGEKTAAEAMEWLQNVKWEGRKAIE